MTYRSPFEHLPDEHMRLVGIIAAHSEAFTVLLQQAVCEAMSLKRIDVLLMLENLSTNAMFDLISGHADMLPDKDATRINKAIGRAQAAYGLRNRFVHSKWSPNDTDPSKPFRFGVRTKGGKIKIVQTPTGAEELEAAADELIAAAQHFTETLQDYGILKHIADARETWS